MDWYLAALIHNQTTFSPQASESSQHSALGSYYQLIRVGAQVEISLPTLGYF